MQGPLTSTPNESSSAPGINIVLVTLWIDAEHGTGTAERTRRLALHLSALGCRCSIVAMGGTAWQAEFADHGIHVHRTNRLGRRYPVPLVGPSLWRILRSADVVFITGFWYLLAASVGLACRLTRKPVIIAPAGELAPFARRGLRKRIYYWLLGAPLLAGASSIVAIVEREREDIAALGVTPSRIIVAANGIDPMTIAENQQSGLELPQNRFLLFVGRLTPIKGPDLLVEAFARIAMTFPDLHLVLAGPDFGMRASLEARVEALGLETRVRILGFVSEADRQRLYRTALMMVVPSRSEVMTMVALEAGVVGTPVLLTDRCGFDEVAAAGGGLVVPAEPETLAQGIVDMMSDPAALREMGTRLRSLVLERYGWVSVALGLKQHFDRTLAMSALRYKVYHSPLRVGIKRRLKRTAKLFAMKVPPIRRYVEHKHAIAAEWAFAAADRDRQLLNLRAEQAAHSTLQKEHDELQKNLRKRELNAEALQAAHSTLQKENDELQENLRERELNAETLNAELAQYRSTIEVLTGERDATLQQVSAARARAEQAELTITKLTAERDDLLVQNQETQLAVEALVTERTGLLEQVQHLEQSEARLKSAHDTALEKIKELDRVGRRQRRQSQNAAAVSTSDKSSAFERLMNQAPRGSNAGLIFHIHVPKTAGTTVCQLFRQNGYSQLTLDDATNDFFPVTDEKRWLARMNLEFVSPERPLPYGSFDF